MSDSQQPPERPQTPNGSVYELRDPPDVKKHNAKRKTAGLQNRSWKESTEMMKVVERASVDPVPSSAKTLPQKAAFLGQPNREFNIVDSDGNSIGTKRGKNGLILGHKGSASKNWNDGLHQNSRSENQKLNNNADLFHGVEPKELSDSSGSKEERYRQPGPHIGSYRAHFEPDEQKYDKKSAFNQYKLIKKPGENKDVGETTPVPYSYSQFDDNGNLTGFNSKATYVDPGTTTTTRSSSSSSSSTDNSNHPRKPNKGKDKHKESEGSTGSQDGFSLFNPETDSNSNSGPMQKNIQQTQLQRSLSINSASDFSIFDKDPFPDPEKNITAGEDSTNASKRPRSQDGMADSQAKRRRTHTFTALSKTQDPMDVQSAGRSNTVTGESSRMGAQRGNHGGTGGNKGRRNSG